MLSPNLQALLKRELKDELDTKELLRICENKVRIIAYEDLATVNNIDDVLRPYGACIILYQETINNGHWVCILSHPDGYIEYFDPYGEQPDFYINNGRLSADYNKIPYLVPLLQPAITSQKFVYNATRFQAMDKNIQTCGRWVAVRIKMKNWTLDKFAGLFKTTRDKDLIISLMTLIFTI